MNQFELPLEMLVVHTIAAGRVIGTDICNSDLGRDGHDRAFIGRCLRCLVEGEPFNKRDEGGFDAVRDRFAREVARETTGTRQVFRGFRDPEIGDIGAVAEVPVLTARGETLHALLEGFEFFMELREEVLDRIRAEKVLAALMAA